MTSSKVYSSLSAGASSSLVEHQIHHHRRRCPRYQTLDIPPYPLNLQQTTCVAIAIIINFITLLEGLAIADIALLDEGIPVSDLIHHVYGMFPPKILHTTNEGITKYIIEVLKEMLSEDDQVTIEKYHRFFHHYHCKGRNSASEVL